MLNNNKYRRLWLYETRELILIVGNDIDSSAFKILEIKRPSIQDNEKVYAKELTKSYNMEDLQCVLNAHKASLLYENVFCIFGLIKLMKEHYLIIVTNASIIGTLNGSNIYTISDTALVPLTYRRRKTIDDDRYKSILQYMQLNKGFYFSYSYDLSNTLQTNYSKSETINLRFIWNSHLLDMFISMFHAVEISSNTLDRWLVYVMHGCIKQQTIRMEDLKVIHYTLISRRSQYFAGTRYLRRGVNDAGNVANEVETEQIISEIYDNQRNRNSSLVQIRGSLPFCWSHTNIFSPNPDIYIDTVQSSFASTIAHFCDICNRYGQRVHLLSLIRHSGSSRDTFLGNYFETVLNSLANQTVATDITPKLLPVKYTSKDFVIPIAEANQIRAQYITFDMLSHDSFNPNGSVFDTLSDISKSVHMDTGFFLEADGFSMMNSISASESWNQMPSKLQVGILRTNCVDCLDRTNIAQFSYAKYVAHEQLKGLGIELTANSLDLLHSVLLDIWVQNGDMLAMQYAGSEAMHKVEEKKEAFFNLSAVVVGNMTSTFSNVKENEPIEVDADVEYIDLDHECLLDQSQSQRSLSPHGKGEKEFVMSGSTYKAVAAVRRYYSNILSDFERQRAMDLVLGVYQCCNNGKHIWELEQLPKAMRGAEFIPKFTFLAPFLELLSQKKRLTDVQPSLSQTKAELRQIRKAKKTKLFQRAFHCDSFDETVSLSSLQDLRELSFNRPVIDMVYTYSSTVILLIVT